MQIKRKHNWNGIKYTLKVIHIFDKYVEAVVTCKEHQLEAMQEKVYKQYRTLGRIRIEKDYDNQGDTETSGTGNSE